MEVPSNTMSNNNLNWVGNKVLNTNSAPRQNSRSAYDTSPNMRYGVPDPPLDPPPATGTAVTPTVPGMTGATVTPSAPGMTGTTVTPSAPGTTATVPPGATTIPTVPPGTTTTVPFQQGFPPATERGYIPYYLASNIGKNVRAEFIIGSNQYSDKTGRLIEVGINYFVLEDVNSRTHIMCDMYSLKFLIVLQDFSHPLF